MVDSKRKKTKRVRRTSDKAKKTKRYNRIDNKLKKKKPKAYLPPDFMKKDKGRKTKKTKKVKKLKYLPDDFMKKDKGKKTKKHLPFYPEGDKDKKGKKFQPLMAPFKSMDVSSRDYNWGLGVEHEAQFFHSPRNGAEGQGNIIFDSQESTCFLTGDSDPAGACCKSRGKCYYHPSNKKLKNLLQKKGDKLTKEEVDWLLAFDWELTGRQSSSCKDVLKSVWIVPRTPVLMPEFITGNHRNRSIESINKELIYLEDKYIKLQMKNPITRRKVDKYGPLRPHVCGTLSDIKVPIRPTIYDDEYQFEPNTLYKDYLGSYHVTITLPHPSDITQDKFLEMHRRFGMAFQWLEPLIIAAYFSPDPDAVASEKKRVEGSYRVMAVGWGNVGGSDLRKLDEGITRAANQKTYWRKKITFPDSDRLNKCANKGTKLERYKKGVDINTSDFRTFAFESDMDKCKRLYNPNDCPKVDGGPMKAPNGIELRIFDHFEAHHLLDLLRIIILIAENAQRHHPTEFVYKDARWVNTLGNVMEKGWNAKVPNNYLSALRHNLGLSIETDSKIAHDVFSAIVKELHQKNKDGMITRLMVEDPQVEPTVPNINRICWEISYNSKFNREMREHIDKFYRKNQKVYPDKFKKNLYKDFMRRKWKKSVEDLMYALESNGQVSLHLDKGKIKHMIIL